MSRHELTPSRWLLYTVSVCSVLLGFATVYGQANEDGVRVAQLSEASDLSDEDTPTTVKYPDAPKEDDPVPLADRAEALDRRAGEQIGDDPSGRAVVLGMHIQEADDQQATVVEVSPASAGIRRWNRGGRQDCFVPRLQGRVVSRVG